MNKAFTLLMAALCAVTFLHAQSVFSKFTSHSSEPSFTKAVETVLGDFPYNYKHITGGLLVKEGDFEQYESTVTLPGAGTCVVGFYHSAFDTTASWQALMFHNEDFEKAAKEYKRLFAQLKKCNLRMVDGSLYGLDGDYEAPDESLDFLTTTLKLQTADERFVEFKVELEMLYKLNEWVVNINMVTRKKDSDQRPDWWQGKSR